MVQRVLDAPLAAGGAPFRLRDIPASARRPELPFHFSLNGEADRPAAAPAPRPAFSLATLAAAIRPYWQTDSAKAAFVEQLAAAHRPVPRGFMTGFIDLLFCYDNRFYIIDWKSNRRSGRIDDFGAVGLADEMQRHAYFLQYLLYTVAVHGFLTRALDGYEYDRHFGGVFYIFLRGVTGEAGRGVFTDRPDRALVDDLAQALTEHGP
jgi:exodeoxyribonuclease V beta subunit